MLTPSIPKSNGLRAYQKVTDCVQTKSETKTPYPFVGEIDMTKVPVRNSSMRGPRTKVPVRPIEPKPSDYSIS